MKMVEVHYTSDEKGFIAEGEKVHPSITKNARTVAENPPDAVETKHGHGHAHAHA